MSLSKEEKEYALHIIGKLHPDYRLQMQPSEFEWILDNVVRDEYENAPMSDKPDVHISMWADGEGSILQRELKIVTYTKVPNSPYYETSEFYRVRAKMGGVVVFSDPEWDGDTQQGRKLLFNTLMDAVSKAS